MKKYISVLVLLFCILFLFGCSKPIVENPKIVLLPVPDLTSEKGIKEYLEGEWIFDKENDSNLACKMIIDNDLNIDFYFKDTETGESLGDYSGFINLERQYATEEEAPDILLIELTDENYPGGYFFFLHRTTYDGKQVMSWFFAANGDSIFSCLTNNWDLMVGPEEIVFEKVTGEKSELQTNKNEEFHAVFWGEGKDQKSLWLDDVLWTHIAEFDPDPAYPNGMIQYENEVPESVLYSISPDKVEYFKEKNFYPGLVYYIHTDNEGYITDIIDVEYQENSDYMDDEEEDKKIKMTDIKIVEDNALEIIEKDIYIYKSSYHYQPGFKIIDSQITKLENIETFENILPSPIEIWELKYKLKAKTKNVELRDEMKEIDGWLIDEGSLGNPYLAFENDGANRIYLGTFYPQEFKFDTLANLEMGLRIMLERNGTISNESYPGNHILISFSLPTGETYQLLLSQPELQGDKGIWIVERWMDEDGKIYYEYPDTNIKIGDHYKNLQELLNNGESLSLGDPVEVGYNFIINKLDQPLVKKSKLFVMNPATTKEFMMTPISHYIGCISGLSTDISGDRKFLYINKNESSEEELIDLSEDTEYKLISEGDIGKYKVVSKEKFQEYLHDNNYEKTFNVYTKDGYVIRIEEQYLP